MKIDENDKVKVILTQAGADTINIYNSFLSKSTTNEIIKSYFRTDYKENDEFKSELHAIMTIFYGSNHHGTEKMFKEIEVLNK